MPLPYLNAPEQSVEMITQFGGYNHRISIAENEFYDMQNMSAKEYPLVSTRSKRNIVKLGGANKLPGALAMAAKDNLLFAYTAEGDIGVTITEKVEAKEWQNPITGEGDDVVDGFTTLYSKIADFRSGEIVESVLNSGVTASSLKSYKDVNGVITSASGKTPVVGGNSDATPDKALYMEWEHEAVSAGTFWAKSLFNVAYVYLRDSTFWGDGDTTIISAVNNEYLNTEEKRNSLIGVELWINGTQKVKIVSIESSGWSKEYSQFFTKNDWTIAVKRVDSNSPPSVTSGDDFMIRMTEPLEAEIPAGKYTADDTTEEPVNQPSKVKVDAQSAMHVKVLKGQTLTINGNEYHVSDVITDESGYYLIIDCPHEAITAGATAYGNRLYLCEGNPLTEEAIISDVFAAAPGRHTVLEMGANVVIFPEKVMVNTHKKNLDGQYTDIQLLEKVNTIIPTDNKKCFFQLVDGSGNNFVDADGNALLTVSNTAPETEENGWGWIDTSTNPPIFKIYSSQIEQWAKTQTYCRIHSEDIDEEWQVGDAIELDFAEEGIMGNHIVPADEQKYFVISKVDHDSHYIYFPVAMKTAQSSTESAVTIKRTIPDMDFIIENENRLWGCKYGVVDGEPINEIFACKLGDPKNWHHFTNTSIDSYYVSLGADGEFTGAISYAGNPFFFREGCIHRIYGNYPSNYALKTINCHGVEKGSEKGITVMNDVMYYKSPVGVMAYTGATPVNVSECFGAERYKNAVAGAVGSKMYFSMQDSEGENVLLAFDDKTKLWHKEDDFRCKDMVAYDNEIYALSEYDQVMAMEGGTGNQLEEDFEWHITSGSIGYNTPFYKHISKLNMRLLMELGTRASIYIQYNSSGNWQHVTNLQPTGKVRNVTVPITPQRCDHFALKISGKGACKILSITKYTEEGSDNE